MDNFNINKYFKRQYLNEGVEKDMFTYLNDLRDSGETNMFGAGAYLQREFGNQ